MHISKFSQDEKRQGLIPVFCSPKQTILNLDWHHSGFLVLICCSTFCHKSYDRFNVTLHFHRVNHWTVNELPYTRRLVFSKQTLNSNGIKTGHFPVFFHFTHSSFLSCPDWLILILTMRKIVAFPCLLCKRMERKGEKPANLDLCYKICWAFHKENNQNCLTPPSQWDHLHKLYLHLSIPSCYISFIWNSEISLLKFFKCE